MKSILKLLIVDINPLVVLFYFYYSSGKLQSAILPFMVATVIAVIFSYILEKKIPIALAIGAIVVLIFGTLSIYFQDNYFIKIKPTIINIIFSLILFIGLIYKTSLLLKYYKLKKNEKGKTQE